MNITEARAILAILATALDRPIPDGLDQIWAHALDDIPYDLGRAAALHLVKTSVFMPKVAELRTAAEDIDRDRRRQARELREREDAQQLAIAAPPADPERVKAMVNQIIAALPVTPSDLIYERARAMARKTKGRPDKPKPVKDRTKRKPKDWPDPQSDDIAALATRYLLDGHDPQSVAERLGVSRRWCTKTATRFRPA